MAAKKDSSFENLPLVGKLFILGLIIAVVGAIYYFAFHMSLAEDIEAQEIRATRLQNELREAEQRQQEYLQLTQELASREGIDRQNKRVLPEDAEIPAFLQDLNRVAELSGRFFPHGACRSVVDLISFFFFFQLKNVKIENRSRVPCLW